MMTFRRLLISGLLLLFLSGANLEAQIIIKVGSIAPSRSPWDKALGEVAAEWEKISEGKVQVKIYAGGIAGNELDMIRKMRLGTLGGAVMTSLGLIKLNGEISVLVIPLLTNSDQEFNYVFDKMKPVFEKQVEDKGFKILFWTQAGWNYFFTRGKAIYPEDMKKYKISFPPDEPEMEQAWKAMGYQVVPNDLKDLMMALQSEMVSACLLPPVLAASGQYFALAPYMLDLKIVPLFGGLVLSEKAWQSIPEKYREPMIKSVSSAAERLVQRTTDLENEAIKAMKDNNLVIINLPADVAEKWRLVASKGTDMLVGKTFSRDIYNQTLELIKEFRSRNAR